MMWFTILGMACITFFNRFVFMSASFSYKPGEKLSRFLGFSSLAVLTAIWLPMVVSFDVDQGLAMAGWDYVLGTFVAAILSVFRMHSLLIVLVSSSVFFGIRFV